MITFEGPQCMWTNPSQKWIIVIIIIIIYHHMLENSHLTNNSLGGLLDRLCNLLFLIPAKSLKTRSTNKVTRSTALVYVAQQDVE